jgi:hypothetical protein
MTADAVVGQPPVEGLDEIGGGGVFDLGLDGGVAELDRGVRLPGARGSDEGEVLACGYPLQRGQVRLRRRRERGDVDVELVNGLQDGNVAALRRQQPISVGDDLDSGPISRIRTE